MKLFYSCPQMPKQDYLKKKKNSEKIQSCSGNIDNKTNSEISKSDKTNIQSEYKASFLLSVNSPTCINLDLFSTYHHYVISKIKQCSNGYSMCTIRYTICIKKGNINIYTCVYLQKLISRKIKSHW